MMMKKLSSDLEGQGCEERERQGRRVMGRERKRERMTEARPSEHSER